jgi:hypothetical protein
MLYNIIYKPALSNNPGYDFRIRYSIAEEVGKFLDVFYQVKFSDNESSTSLTSEELRISYSKCAPKASSLAAGFAVVFMTWRNGGQVLEVPSNCLLLHREKLKDTLGPNFANFIGALSSRPMLMRISS